MDNKLFFVDGVPYKVRVPAGGLKRSFKVLDGPNAGRLLTADMTRDVLGTFYNYNLSVIRDGSDLEEYDRLYEVLSAPVDYHIVTLPYGQDMMTFHSYVTAGEDRLLRRKDDKSYWEGLSIDFIAMGPARRA